MANIPVKNIYYMFCYAWQRMDVGQSLPVGLEDAVDARELFTKVLIHATKSILKKGLDRDYLSVEEGLTCPKGKFVFSETVKRNLLEKHQLHCSYDELSHNVLHNQILKSTLLKLSKVPKVDKTLRDEARALAFKFYDVDEIRVRPSDFRKIQLHRNNAYYDFLMKICEMINLAMLPEEGGDGFKFSDFLNDEKRMGEVFESFVKNFYAVEQKHYGVKSEEIRWDAVSDEESDMAYLPIMKTDISLTKNDKKIIIDTKYYKQTMQLNWGTEKVHSGHLYQLTSYLSNIEGRGFPDNETEGILLYPTINKPLDLNYKIQGRRVRVKTINLNQEWKEIRTDLLSLLS